MYGALCAFDMLLTITQVLFRLPDRSKNLGSDTVEAERMEEENKGHSGEGHLQQAMPGGDNLVRGCPDPP